MDLCLPGPSDVVDIHAGQMQRYGGEAGIRDVGLLESAVGIPMEGSLRAHSAPAA